MKLIKPKEAIKLNSQSVRGDAEAYINECLMEQLLGYKGEMIAVETPKDPLVRDEVRKILNKRGWDIDKHDRLSEWGKKVPDFLMGIMIIGGGISILGGFICSCHFIPVAVFQVVWIFYTLILMKTYE